MADFKRLLVWQRAYELSCGLYHATRDFPPSEQFGLTGQIRRSAISVAVNIAESSGRYSRPDQLRLLRIARGSSLELEALLLLAHGVALLSETAHSEAVGRVVEVQKMLSGLIRYLERSTHPS